MIPIVLFTACTTKTAVFNAPITADKIKILESTKNKKNTDELSLILTFSGGGTRAASLSYGVLKELRRQKLLDQIDVISSVSGGSFTSTYYGLYGEKIFEDFEEKFLKKPIQTRLIDTFINPLNWFDLSFDNRSDYIASYYEDEIFGKKTFADLKEDGPKIIINATDLSTGNAFSFTHDTFYRLCSDLDSYPLGQAVTASSAVPVVFSPLTLKNYSGCNPRFYQKRKLKNKLSHNDKQSLYLRAYQDKEKYPYVHLIDGGIADNLGVRSLFHIVSELDNDFLKVRKVFGIPNSKKIAIIVVNASDALNPKIAQNKISPDIETTVGAVSTIQFQRYNNDTLDLVNRNFKTWTKQVNDAECKDLEKECDAIKFYLIELNFNQLPKDKAKKFSLTKTSLELPAQKVDELILAGEFLLRNSKEFNTLLEDLKK
jgi:NTE family protein